MKTIFVIIDGVGDRKIESLGNKSPLEKADTKNLDFFAKIGASGRVEVIKKGIAPESDPAIMALLGFDPFRFHAGRGPIEALGCGIKLGKSDLALRANFATIEGKKTIDAMSRKKVLGFEGIKIIDRRVGRSLLSSEGKILAREINKKVKLREKFLFAHSVEHRGVLVIRKGKKGLSAEISNTDPAYGKVKGFGVAKEKFEEEVQKCIALDKNSSAKYAAELVNEFTGKAMEVLGKSRVNVEREKKGLPKANCVLLRDAGIGVPELPKKNKRKNWIAVVGMPLEKGLTGLAGMKMFSFKYPELTKGQSVWENLEEKLKEEIKNSKKAIKKNWKKANGFYVHFKEVDNPGHNGDIEEKIKMIEMIDKEFFSWARKEIDLKDARIVVTADHATPCELKAHSDDFVPLLIAGKNVMQDKEKKFSEFNNGAIGLIKGKNVMKLTEAKIVGKT